MFDSAIEILEFPRVLEIISGHAVSEPGSERVKNLRPKADIELVNLELQRVEEMAALLEAGSLPPFKGIHDLTQPLKTASVAGAMLSAETLLQFGATLGCARVVRKFLLDRAKDISHLADMARVMTTFEELEGAVHRAIDETGEIRDSASPELKSIRRDILTEKRRSRQALATILKDWNEKGLLQEEIVASREGRLTLPVKDNLKSRVKGILVDQSSSGQTVFIEPIQLVEINNTIRKLELEEKREIERILREITAIVYKYRFEIEETVNILLGLDSLFARASYARKFDCNRPQTGSSKGLKIVNGRHPLLLIKESEVVPLNLEIEDGIFTLVISGPNAGGKTVSLKTVGLLTLMAMAGCFIPVDKETRLPLPTEIHAVIGDDQSIAADLSTFTAHVAKLSRVVETNNTNKLVLIDEIMSGTDPNEGTALAISLLEKLTSEGALTLATTHKGDLKAFAHRTEGVMNGSLEFDPVNLSPTYRFRTGIPGSSYAFAIADKVGFPGELIDRSREIRGEDRGSLDNLILELQEKLSKVERDSLSVDEERRRCESLQNQLEEKLKNARSIEKKLQEKAIADADKVLADANRAIEQAVREIREKEASTESIKSARLAIEQARKNIPKRRRKPVRQEKRAQGPIEIGDRVQMEESDVIGAVTQGRDSHGRFLVESGSIKIWVEGSKLIKLQPKKGEQSEENKRERVRVRYDLSNADVSPEIDLRGLDSREASAQLQEYLLQASRANFNRIDIIHGKGSGVLRKVVADVLAGSDLVKNFRPGSWGEGDYGITIAEMES